MSQQYTEVGRYPSSSSPGKEYIVKKNLVGVLSCNCRGWTMKKPGKARTCPHVQAAAADMSPAPASPPPASPSPARASEGGNLADMLRAVREAKGNNTEQS